MTTDISVEINYTKLAKYLGALYEEVKGADFYREIFPNNQNEGSLLTGYQSNAIYLYSDGVDRTKLKRRIMLKDTFDNDYSEFVYENNFALCSGLSYRGRANRLENAQNLHALIIDLDSVTVSELENLMHRMGKSPGYRTIPQATYIVLSGTGLHIYYVLDKPIELYPNIKLQMKSLKYDLTFKIWEYKSTSLEKVIQYQSISQGYRMVGSNNDKYGLPIRAFRVGNATSLDILNSYVIDKNNMVDINLRFKPSKYTLDESKELFPDWYEKVIVKGDKTHKQWNIKPDLYYWWLKQIDKVKGGHRYYFLMCMSIYAIKCNIPKSKLIDDMNNIFNLISDIEHSNKLTKEDMVSALEAYDRGYYNFTIDDIVKLTDIEIIKNKRNYQSQKDHLEEARAVRDIRMKRQNRNWYDGGGRPLGSGTKEQLVKQALLEHPNLSISELSKLINVSRTTIYKYKED